MDRNGTVVTLISVTKKSGEQYSSGREKYVGCKGLLFIEINPQTGKSSGSFFTEQNGSMCRFATSAGSCEESKKQIKIETKNSVYIFHKGVSGN